VRERLTRVFCFSSIEHDVICFGRSSALEDLLNKYRPYLASPAQSLGTFSFNWYSNIRSISTNLFVFLFPVYRHTHTNTNNIQLSQ
jgi:hypothetical protein